MDLQDKIVVLLPIYRGDKYNYFQQSLNSILNQSYRNVLIYIGVDGPVSPQIRLYLEEIENDARIRVFNYEVNRGLSVVLNDLLQVCFKENINFIARMDADDIARPERFKKQLTFMLTHPDIDVVGGAISEINEEGDYLNKTIQYPLTSAECRKFFSKRNPLAHPAVLFRKRFFEKAGIYRNEYRQNQDTILWFDGFMNDCQFANIPDTILDFRITYNLLKKRRSGYKFARKNLTDRLKINRKLHYGLSANLFAFFIFLITVSPVFVKRLAYKFR